MDKLAQAILQFWFGTADLSTNVKRRKAWFVKDPVFDEEIRSRFLGTWESAAEGTFQSWLQNPLECLALVILLDQFPRNLFRGDPRAFATDEAALAAAQHGVLQGFDRALPPVARTFLYLPFEHSEQLHDQRRSIELFESMEVIPEMSETIRYAQRHYEIIARFGRFPHRNAALGRQSTFEEEAFLNTPGSSF